MSEHPLIELTLHATAATTSPDHKAMLILREKNGERILPILTSPRRAMLLMARDRLPIEMPVPVSVADVSHLLMSRFGIHLKYVELTAVKEGVFFAKVVAEGGGEEHVVDFCQAPDGLVMAVTARCPILISEELLEAQYMHKLQDGSFAMNINIISRAMLEDALQQAVAQENYEAASRLRDEILKRKGSEDPLAAASAEGIDSETDHL